MEREYRYHVNLQVMQYYTAEIFAKNEEEARSKIQAEYDTGHFQQYAEDAFDIEDIKLDDGLDSYSVTVKHADGEEWLETVIAENAVEAEEYAIENVRYATHQLDLKLSVTSIKKII